MRESISQQHPAVVLRSHYTHLRALLAVALVTVACLTAAVIVLATNDSDGGSSASAPAIITAPAAPDVRYDGGPEEGTRGQFPAPNFGGVR